MSSMTRSAIVELCSFVQEKSVNLLGNKFWDCRLCVSIEAAVKSEKFEHRIFVISKFRVFLLIGKTPVSLKVDKCFNLLSIRSLQLISPSELIIGLDEVSNVKRSRLSIRSSDPGAHQLILHLLSAFKHYFPDASIRSQIELVPIELYKEYDALPLSRPLLPCRNFRRSYAAVCDHFDQPFREEVVWDVEKIYSVHYANGATLRLEDFSHLLAKDLMVIVAVLQYSQFFTGLLVDGLRLNPELIETILTVTRRSTSLNSLQLRNCALPKEFVFSLGQSLQSNPILPLSTLDLSKNLLDDKRGFAFLGAVLSKMEKMPSRLTLNECGLTEKCVNGLAIGLFNGYLANSTSCLTVLNLSSNQFKDDINDLCQLLAQCTSLQQLELAETGILLDKLWTPLKFGGLKLRLLNLAGCTTGRKSTAKDVVQVIPLANDNHSGQAAKEFFSSVVELEQINLAGVTLPCELLKAMLMGLASNQQTPSLALNLDTTLGSDKAQSCAVLETGLPSVNVHSLSLRDNGLEMEMAPLIAALARMPKLVHLDLGGANLTALRRHPKQAVHLTNVLLELVKLIGDEECALKGLVLSDCRLGVHMSVLLNTLGVASSLRSLDISGNEMGNFGARLLAKALQINPSLETLNIDRNQITADGYADLAHALKLNHSLTTLPYPIIDAAESMNRADRSKTLSALSEMAESVSRNRSRPSIGRLGDRQRLVGVQEELNKALCSTAQKHNMALLGLQKVLEECMNEEKTEMDSSIFDAVIEEFCHRLRSVSAKHVEKSLSPLLSFAASEGVTLPPLANRDEHLLTASLRDLVMAEHRSLRSHQLTSAGETALHVLMARCTSSSNPSTPSPKDRSIRPKSIVHETSTESAGIDSDQPSASFDSPPQPSTLVHLSKQRPRPHRHHRGAKAPPSTTMEMSTSSASEESPLSEAVDPPQLPPRRALLPPPAPPPKPDTPPERPPPPKPTEISIVRPERPPPPRLSTPPPPRSVDEQNGNAPSATVRRSVADMARAFSTTTAPEPMPRRISNQAAQ